LPPRVLRLAWRLEDLGWELLLPRRLAEWDGMLGWFLKYTEKCADLLGLGGVRDWQRATMPAIKES
jgi:hypothetical protein